MSGATTPLATTSALPLRMAWGIVLINLFVFGMAGFVLYQSHGEYEERSGMIAQNLSRMLALDMSREFDKIDVTLLVAQDEIEGQLARGIDAAHLNDFLRRLKEHVPEIISLRMADERGIVRYGVGVDPRVRIDNSDREYFIRQRTDPHSGLLVSAPLMARIDKRWVVVVSRALRRADGSFAGIVYANVSIDHLVQLLSSVEVGPRDSSSLRDTGLRIYARYPVPKDVGQVYGKRLEVPELQALIDAGQDAGTYISSHTVDGVERRFAVRRVDKLPLYVVVGRASDEYMLPWRKQAEQTLAVSLLFFLTSLAASWLIYRSWHSQMSATAVLAREEEKFHTVADHTYDWEYWEGPQGEIRYMSPSCQRVTGYAQSEFVADPALLQRIVHPDDRALLAAHRHDIEHQDEAALDFRILRWNGETRWLAHVCLAVFGRDGQYMGRRVSNRDITERKQAEAALSRLNTELERHVAQRTSELETAIYDLENFNYSASHDLRIPLRAVDGFSWLLLHEHAHQLDAEGKRLLDVVRVNTRRMAQIIDDMQSFSRAGRMVMAPGDIDMDELVREVMEELKPASAGREVRVEVKYLAHVYADRALLRWVMLNLLGNAIKFTRTRTQAVIEVGAQAAENETVFYVKDNGVGFDMQYADKLFGVFQRLHGVEEFEGAGIGLAIVKRIVSRLGGRVWAEGKVDQGATFYFSIPPAVVPLKGN
jgi:PAS domain S-box-containing protein